MAYSKQNFQDGQILNAANLEAMENGIIAGQGARNLLDNSDFRNPVNQRGITETSGNGYFIDRWGIYDGTSKVISSGIQVNANRGNPTFLYQYIKALRDGIYTFAAKVNGNIVLRVIQISGTTATTIDGNKAGYTGGYLIVIYANDDKFEFDFRVESGSTITVAWAALYEGSYDASTLPAYQPKGYAAELAECQLCYRRGVQAATIGKTYTAGSIFSIHFPKMRIDNPTINLIDIISQGWGNVDKNNYTSAWGDATGGENYMNFISSVSDDIGKTIVVFYESSADL